MHSGVNATLSHYFPSPLGMKRIIKFITHYVVCKTKYCWYFINEQFHTHRNQQWNNKHGMWNTFPLNCDLSSKMKIHVKILKNTGKHRSENCNLARALYNATTLLIRLYNKQISSTSATIENIGVDVFALRIHCGSKIRQLSKWDNRLSLEIDRIQAEWIGRRYRKTWISVRPWWRTMKNVLLNPSVARNC